MIYTTEDLYWEDSKNWYRAKIDNLSYYYHNDEVSCWSREKKIFTGTLNQYKDRIARLQWKITDERYIRDTIKINHYKDDWKGRNEYSYLSDGYDFGNQASKYISALGKGDKRRFTMILDDDLYEDIVSTAQQKGLRRNTFLNDFIRHSYEQMNESEVA